MKRVVFCDKNITKYDIPGQKMIEGIYCEGFSGFSELCKYVLRSLTGKPIIDR